MSIEWLYWPQYKHHTLTRTRKVNGAEDEVTVIVISRAMARRIARRINLAERKP